MLRPSKTDYQFIVFALFIIAMGITNKTMTEKPKIKVQSTYTPKEYRPDSDGYFRWVKMVNASRLYKLTNN